MKKRILLIFFLCCVALWRCKKEAPIKTVAYYLEHRAVLKADEATCNQMSLAEFHRSRMCRVVAEVKRTLARKNYTSRGKEPERMGALPGFHLEDSPKEAK